MLRKREFLVTLKSMLSDEKRWREKMREIADEVWEEMDADGNGRCDSREARNARLWQRNRRCH